MINSRMQQLLVSAALGAPLVGMATSTTRQQALSNVGFEARDVSNRPAGWYAGGNGYEIVLDSTLPLAGRYSLRSHWTGAVPMNERAFGVVTMSFPQTVARGRALRLTGYIRTEDVSSGYAGFWMRVDRGTQTLAFDNMSKRGVQGTTPWTKYEIELPVDSGASGIVLGALHPGTGTAWFDSVTVEVVGPPRPRTAADIPPFRPAARITEDSTRLLTDAELALPVDAEPAPRENDAWHSWIRTNARPIRSLGATDFSDLRFLEPLLRGKRIVQLGESGHGVAEFDLAKVRFIKYLHEELGYDVIAFESSVFECDRAQRAVATLSADEMMRACIFGVWHAAETQPLFDYVKQTQSTAHPLVLAGFDSQTSSWTANARPKFFRDLIAKIDTTYARDVETRDTYYLTTLRGRDPTGLKRGHDAMIAFYDSLATWFRANEPRLVKLVPDDPFAPMIARQTATSMIAFTRQVSQDVALGTSVRDHAMADNLDFLLAERFPGKKMMVWAHNFHVQHREHVVTRDDGAAGSTAKTMGVWTAQRHRAELYTIGLFMYRGAAAMNNRQVYPISRASAGSLESIMHGAPWRYAFVDLSRPAESPGTSWMFQKIPTLSWGTQVEPLVLRDEYDGILFIDTTHPPTYVPATTNR